MKIASVDIFKLRCEKTDWSWNPVVVRVNTDEGISGYGEAGVAYGHAADGAVGQLREFSSMLIGWDPMRIEAVWDHLYRNTFWGQGGGSVIFSAVSALDIALWDIRGKTLQVPVYQLLGGKTRDRLRCYASQLQFGWDGQDHRYADPCDYAAAAKKAVAEGYTAVKVDPFQIGPRGQGGGRNTGLLTYGQIQLYRGRLRAVREAVGPAVDVILECHAGLDANSAVQFGNLVEDLDIYYMEEPCTPLNPFLTKEIQTKLRIPLAAGERIYTRFGYRPFLENRALNVIQPDLCSCGGITEGKKICDLAYTYEVSVQPHICGSPIATAAALQLEAVIPNFLIHEHHEIALKNYNRDCCIYDYQPVNGVYQIPDLPGIGQELSQRAMEEASLKVTVK